MKTARVATVFTALLIILIISGCDLIPTDTLPDPVTIVQRLTSFENILNTDDRSTLYTLFHEDTAGRQNVADDDVFDVGPLSYAYEPFDIVIPDPLPAEDAEGKVTVDTTFTNDNFTAGSPGSITFVMQEQEADVWYILSLSVQDTVIVQTVH